MNNKAPADIMEIAGNATSRRGAAGGAGMWHADLIYGHPQNGRSANNGQIVTGNNGYHVSNGYISNGNCGTARGMNGNGTVGPPISIPIINPGSGFPLIRGNEINV